MRTDRKLYLGEVSGSSISVALVPIAGFSASWEYCRGTGVPKENFERGKGKPGEKPTAEKAVTNASEGTPKTKLW